MKFCWKKISIALVAFAISTQAWSLILIEPYGGYNFSMGGDAKNSSGILANSTEQDIDFSGFGYGARLGLQLMTIMFGVSYDMMQFDTEYDTSKMDVGTEQTNLGVFVGWNPKLDGIRFWAEYFLDVTNTYDLTGDPEDSGDGFGVGLGYKFNPWLALNAEYRSWSLDEGTNMTGTDVNGQSIFVSLSFPFDIL